MSRKRALPNIVADALERIWEGATADDLESAVLDFKEDPAHTPTAHVTAKTADMLVRTAACFANGSAGRAFIVFGIADRTPGPAAFNGTGRDPADIAHTIFANTRPHLAVDAWSTQVHGARLVIIRVAAGMAVYTGFDGVVKHRVGDSCLPLDGAELAEMTRARRNPDPTAQPVALPASALDRNALAVARGLLAEHRDRTGQTPDQRPGQSPVRVPGNSTVRAGFSDDPAALFDALDLLTDDGSPTVAAKILFGMADPEHPVARHIFRDAGGEIVAETELHDPLVLAARSLHRLVRSHSDAGIPPTAQTEALNNALLHRDWSRPDPVVVYQSADMLRVSSPGGLPPGASAERLLSGPSQPRNPALVNAVQQLGMVEWSSRGFDRMWVSMLSAGFEPPTVDVRADSVDVVLFDGVADLGFVAALSAVRAEFGRGITRDAATLVVLRYLLGSSGGAGPRSAGAAVITLERVAALQQATEADARTLMTWLSQRGLLHRTSRRRDEWRLSDRTLAVVSGSGRSFSAE